MQLFFYNAMITTLKGIKLMFGSSFKSFVYNKLHRVNKFSMVDYLSKRKPLSYINLYILLYFS